MSTSVRLVLLLILFAAIASALSYYIMGEPSLESFGMALFLIAIWVPVKGVLYRRFGGKKPYYAALAANAASELTGLPFSLTLSFWALMGTSFIVSGVIETVALIVLGTGSTLKRCLLMGFYGSLVVHLITAGWFASQRSLAVGLPFLLAGIVLFHVPALFTDRFEESP